MDTIKNLTRCLRFLAVGGLLLAPMSAIASLPATLPVNVDRDQTVGTIQASAFWNTLSTTGAPNYEINVGVTVNQIASGQFAGDYHYVYTLNDDGAGSGATANNFNIEIGSGWTAANLSANIFNINNSMTGSNTPTIQTGLGSSFNSNTINALRWNLVNTNLQGSTVTISFDSTIAPVWGSFLLNGGIVNQPNTAQAANIRFGIGTDANSFLPNFLPVLGQVPVVITPEPESLLLMGTFIGFAACCFYKKRNELARCVQ